MKKLFFVCAVLLAGSVAAQKPAGGASAGPIISWEKTVYDFGDIPAGDKVEHTFRFKNTGNAPLIITNVQVTCGCTTPKGWARDPIAPGESGEITIAFNTLGKFGLQKKVVTVISNATNQDENQITFNANVVERKGG
jgi:archaellum component FlaG (FlaF/FlaG flagellin family)